MNSQTEVISDLRTLNGIAQTLNQAVDIQTILDGTLVHLVELMGLETGWVFLRDETAIDTWWGTFFVRIYSVACSGVRKSGSLTISTNGTPVRLRSTWETPALGK